MTVTDDYLANNAQYASTFNGPLPLPPSKHVAVVACMDARLDVYRILGLNEGEAHVIRNAGGVVTDDVIRSLAISQRLLGTAGDHPDPPHRLRDAHLHRRRLQARHPGGDRRQAAVGGRGLPRPEAEDVRQSLRRIENSPFVTKHVSAARIRLRRRHRQARTRSRSSRKRFSRPCRWRGPWRAACPPGRRSRPRS